MYLGINMTRVSLNKKVGIHVLVDRELDLWISATAGKTGKTRTQIITDALLQYLQSVNPDGAKKFEQELKRDEETRRMEAIIQEVKKEVDKGIQTNKTE